MVDWDDADESFLVTFTDELLARPAERSEAAFKLLDEGTEKRTVEIRARPNQQRFKFKVLARYGSACAVCDIEVPEVLDAVHLAEKASKGSDHPANGLVLCATHHRAFDRGLYCIHPETLQIYVQKGTGDLHFTRASVAHLKAHPHSDALDWRWSRWNSGSEAEPRLSGNVLRTGGKKH